MSKEFIRQGLPCPRITMIQAYANHVAQSRDPSFNALQNWHRTGANNAQLASHLKDMGLELLSRFFVDVDSHE